MAFLGGIVESLTAKLEEQFNMREEGFIGDSYFEAQVSDALDTLLKLAEISPRVKLEALRLWHSRNFITNDQKQDNPTTVDYITYNYNNALVVDL